MHEFLEIALEVAISIILFYNFNHYLYYLYLILLMKKMTCIQFEMGEFRKTVENTLEKNYKLTEQC